MRRGRRRKEKKGGTKVLIFILVILILVAGAVLAYKIVKDKNFTSIFWEKNKDS